MKLGEQSAAISSTTLMLVLSVTVLDLGWCHFFGRKYTHRCIKLDILCTIAVSAAAVGPSRKVVILVVGLVVAVSCLMVIMVMHSLYSKYKKVTYIILPFFVIMGGQH